MKRILVVDDEPSIRHALLMGLTSEEFEVESAEDGKSGIRLGSSEPYDVLIVDLCLPDNDGLEVIRQIESIFPKTASIIMTGNSQGSIPSDVKRQSVSAFLEKPLELHSVKKAIITALKQQEEKCKPK